MWGKGFILFCFILLILSNVCYGQLGDEELEAEPTPEPTVEPGATPVIEPKQTPVPYEEDEFPQWAKDLRRAEIIVIGSIPFTMFLAIEVFDIYRYVSEDFNEEYAPWPFRGSAPYELEEKIGVVITAVSFSVCIAIIDYIIVRVNRGKKPVPKSRK
jgi:hypothetical protein